MQVTVVDINKIEVPKRIRPLNKGRVEWLKRSIAAVGLLNPIIVWAPEDSRTILAAGAHRLQAAVNLGLKVIDAVVMTGTEIDRQLVEIDENLCRSDLGPAERALHMFRRKELWLAKRAATQRRDDSGGVASEADENKELGGHALPTELGEDHTVSGKPTDGYDSRGQRKSSQQQPGFAGATAAITGESKRAVNMDVRRVEKLGQATVQNIAGTSLDKCVELDALVKLAPKEQAELAAHAKAGEHVSAKKVLEAKGESSEAQNKSLAKRAVAALEKCAVVMDEREFVTALKGVAVPENVACLALVISTSVGGEPGPCGASK